MKMRPIVTDQVMWSVGLSVIVTSPAKTAEKIEILFGLWTSVGLRNHVLNGGPDRPMQRGNFGGGKYMPADLSLLTAAMSSSAACAVVTLSITGTSAFVAARYDGGW